MDSSGEYTVEYKFTADVKGLEQGVNQAKNLVKDAANSVGKDFKVNWGEGAGSIEDYTKWLGQANKEWESYVAQQAEATSSTESFTSSMTSLSNTTAETASASEETVGSMGALESSFWETMEATSQLDLKTQALLATITALEAKFAKDSLDAFAKYEDAMYGMATTVGNVGGTIEQAMAGMGEATSSGLLSDADAAKAINNLTAYGYSVQEATELIKAMTVSVEAHGNRNNTVAENVLQLTEAIKRQSSRMLQTQGYSESLTQSLERYATATGTTASELDKAERRQAEYNALIQDSVSYMAIADSYNNSYSASSQRLSNSIDNLKVAFGEVLAPLATFISNAAAWIIQNKELVVGIGTFVGVIAGAGGLIVAVTKLLPMIGAAISFFSGLHVATKGVILGLATVAATMAVVAATSGSLNKTLSGLTQEVATGSESADEGAESYDNLGASIGGVGGAARDTSKELEKLRRQYLDELKTIENRHKETIDKLTKQIQEANVDYKRAVDERNAEFEVQQAKEEKAHQEKVDEIMTQIAFLQRYNNDFNKQKLANLEFALAKENALYQKQTEAEKAELELQNENDKKAYEEKTQQLRSQLEEEMAFMEKHRLDLQEVQGWILEDEIEALKRRYEEQQASYEQQAIAAGGAGAAIGDNFVKNLEKKLADAQNGSLQQNAFNLGSTTSKSVIKGAWEHIMSVANNDDENFLAQIWKAILGEDTFNRLKYGSTGGWAEGGYTGQGAPNEVAGVVHKGEYVLPQEMVDQNTGTPKALGNTYNIYLSGTFATSAAERRKVADQIVQAINQNNKSRLEASWQ